MEESTSSPTPGRDPRLIARKYQLELCKRAVEENIIVYLGTGCGKTHIAALLMYELGHLIRKPNKQICVFLAPTVPLVRQQAVVIENSTDFLVQSYFGNHKHLKNHDDWEKEIEQYEVLVMTPQILLQNLRHCFIRMDLVALLILDECHHAQAQKRHPYAQIMKEFYKVNTTSCPRIFGMTASPIIGKGGSNQSTYTKCINSLENLLNAKVCSVDDNVELESVVASPDIKVYFYGPVMSASRFSIMCSKKLEEINSQCVSIVKEKTCDPKALQKKIKLLWRDHDNLLHCLESIGLWGTIQAARILLTGDGNEISELGTEDKSNDKCLANQYLKQAISVLNCSFFNGSFDGIQSGSSLLEALEEPYFSNKLSVLIRILHKYREHANIKCIVFVKRILVAQSLAYILSNLKSLDFWKCESLVGFHSGYMSRRMMNDIVGKFCAGEVNLLVATNVAEEGLDIQTCCLVVRFDLPETVASFIQSRGRARMLKSEYVFLVERDNQREKKLLNDFMSSEDIMNREIMCRTSSETFNDLEETTYKVDATGALISTGCSVSLLHHYCSKLPHDPYFKPLPEFYFFEELEGTVCTIILPSNSPLRRVRSQPAPSKDEAKRAVCLKACMELHARGALTDYLLPGQVVEMKKQTGAEQSSRDGSEDDSLREELHEMLVPSALKVPWTNDEDPILLHFYHIRFIPVPKDRKYRDFGVLIKVPLPEEAETMEVDLHLAHGRIVKTNLRPSGRVTLNKAEILLSQKFQEMFLKVILDRSEFISDFISFGKKDPSESSSSTFYLLLPVVEHGSDDRMTIDWPTVRCCLSSPDFSHSKDSIDRGFSASRTLETLKLANGPFDTRDILNSLVVTPRNNLFFFIDDILYETNAYSQMKGSMFTSYAENYLERFEIKLLHPKQPLLKAKQLFVARNLLHNRLQDNTETRELDEHFVELPPELCSLKILGFSKDIGSSLSLLPSFMHRLENMLVAIELKSVLSASFAEASNISAYRVLEALTTEKCLERFSLERLEVLGDAFLKYAVGRHCFLSYEAIDEGQLTKKRSSTVNNSHLYELAIDKSLQVYIRDVQFDPSQFFALGRPCTVLCSKDTELNIHLKQGSHMIDGAKSCNIKCTKSHQWLHRKTIADVVEALVGAFLVDSGFKAAIAFLRWIGIYVDFEVSDVYRICDESKINLSLIDDIDIGNLENLLGYRFLHRGLLLQAFVHPSFNKHSGGCYQRLEFLGDAILEYLITSYLYSVYPNLKPGQLTDLRSITVNNNFFAHIAVRQTFHEYLIKDSNSLTKAINEFERFVHASDLEKELLEEPACPKVLGDIVESCIGAILLDSGFDLKCVWRIVLNLLGPVFSFSNLNLSSIRELRELCQFCDFELSFPDPVKEKGAYIVEIDVRTKDMHLSFSALNPNSKAAKKMAAQEAVSKLKALGFKHKNKSLEEIVHSTLKKEPQLIGFDETPIVFDLTDSLQQEKLQLRKEIPRRSRLRKSEGDASPESKRALQHQPQVLSSSVEGERGDPTGLLGIGSAKSRLFEICAENFWKPPSFVCCKEEGFSHLKMFTFKVTIQVEGAYNINLECLGEPRAKKKAAQEHAAEGALWYLKQEGYSYKPV